MIIRTRTVELSDPLADDPPAHGGVTCYNLQFFFTPVSRATHTEAELQMSTIPVFGDVKGVYGEQVGDVEQRYAKLVAAFAEAHGGEKPDLFARSPGRVNLDW